ncbi:MULTISPECIES: ABC transporter ATP-binding protein [Haloarcula]|uniref:ABC-type D-xylose/L-arabinose transporter n=1 Tax=Haloarcula pellucida TaxID=1427151 RepID=A0A830GM35_9EURY|nr:MULTISPECIES: ABC transporter ATP-binding protein [Halomicroarcula]MBX0348912.1 ABC transporter ATP-binding protein [Halomicroarcula pellucida]MDS0278676.1 ABC transporter ATP-binding protein [Halomicroarcula sp. S1AR25-4]GGN91276.1 ABC transporter ATP-binding protein [Halomicroarcula pellucida]
MAHLALEHVTKVFEDGEDEIVAVDDVSVEIRDGEFLVLVGPSGCGKSTTLRMIAGLETITDGEIRLGETVLNDVRTQDRDIAMVFQSYALYPHLTARRNMSFGLEESTDLADTDIDERVTEVASMMGISDLLDRKPGQLSGGQQQRVALGRAIVRDPEVFLMDEPLSNLDAKLRAEMRTELQQLQEQLGVTTVYVTHDQTEAMTMADRIAVMNDGRLQQVGPPLELYHAPENLFVAEFIGEPSMNFLSGRREGSSFVTDRIEYPFTETIADAVGDAEDVILGVRPEDVEILAAGDGSDPAREFEMTATVVEPMGNENVVHLEFPGETTGTEDLVAITEGLREIEENESVTVHLPEETIHVFDTATGEALHTRQLELDAQALRL